MKFIKAVTYFIFISGFQGVTVAWLWYEINAIKKSTTGETEQATMKIK